MKQKTKIDWRIVVVAITGLTVIECYAMSQGINGTFRALITAIIAGLAGFSITKFGVIDKNGNKNR